MSAYQVARMNKVKKIKIKQRRIVR